MTIQRAIERIEAIRKPLTGISYMLIPFDDVLLILREEASREAVTRLVVIDHRENGHGICKGIIFDNSSPWELSYQDGGKTLKVFFNDE